MRFILALVLILCPQDVVNGPTKINGPTIIKSGVGGSSIVVTGKTCFATQNFSDPTCTWSANPSVGETIHCGVSNQNGTLGTPFSVSDNASPANSYTANGSSFLSADLNGSFQFFDSFSITHSPSTTTLTTTGTNQNITGIGCISTTGGVGSVDAAVGTVTGNTVTTMSATIVPTGSADLALFWVATNNGTAAATYTAGSGFTLIGTTLTSSRFTYQMEYSVLSSSGSQSCPISWNQSSTSGNGGICGTWK